MAHTDSDQRESYQKDSFDNPPEGPVGVHRGARPFWVRATPFVVVLVVAAAAGVLFWSIFSGAAANIFGGSSAASSTQTTTTAQTTTSTPSESTSVSETTSASATPSESESTTASPSNTPEESQQVNLGATISVRNATLRQGYAGEEAAALQNAGFTDVTAGNAEDIVLPQQTVVWYQNDADLATAQRVAETLGISTVEQSTSIPSPITVVLME